MARSTRHLSRRNFLSLAGLTASASVLTACGGSGGGDASATGPITFANWSGSDSAFEAVLSSYEQQRSLSVERQANVPFADYQTRFRALLAGGSPPDVMRMDDDTIRELAGKQQILDLRPYIERGGIDPTAYFESTWRFPVQSDGSHTGVAIGIQPRMFFYNRTMFEEAGVPLPPTTWTDDGWKWEDFLRTAQALTVPGQRWGALVYNDTGYENTFAVNNGGEGRYSADGTRFALADPAGVEAVQWVADLTLVHEVQPPWGEIQADQADLQMFAAGKIGMLSGVTGWAPYFRENVRDFEWDVAPVPGRVRQQQEGSLIVFVIPANADQPDAAWDLLNYMCGPDAGRMFAEAFAFIPVHKASAEAATNLQGGPQHASLYVEAAEHHQSVNATSGTSQSVQIYRPQLDLVYTGQATAAQALGDIRPQVEAVLSGI